MSGTIAELKNIIEPENLASQIGLMYHTFRSQTQGWRNEQLEKRNFLFATDTSTTSTAAYDWQNQTTLPKLTQIRDNLHANYMAAMFPNDDWFTWQADDKEATSKAKREAILAYMKNKVRKSFLRSTVSKLLFDFIDYGNVFADVEYANEKVVNPVTLEETIGYIGPRVLRIDPMNIVINPTAISFAKSPKITRHIWTIGEFRAFTEKNPQVYNLEALATIEDIRSKLTSGWTSDDFEKAEAYSVDGFGSLYEYYQSEFIELLEFEGDIYDSNSDTMKENVVITVANRSTLLREEQNPTWFLRGTKVHGGWRERPDNLYAMGPLDNLVGMQHRIDHLENAKADAVDLNIDPPKKIVGDVSEFTWGPGEEILVGEDGDVFPMPVDLSAMNINVEIERLEMKMEEFVGAPREAMGIRSPGEKTAFEVDTLSNAASRIFQEKLDHFEIVVLEPLLNNMLEVARREMSGTELVSVMDNDIGVQAFLSLTKEDITAEGKLRPIGARHFAAQAKLTTNLMGLANSPLFQVVAPHMSGKKLAVLVEEVLGLKRFDLFSEFIGIEEQMEAAEHANQLEEDAQVAGTVPEPELPEGQPQQGALVNGGQ